MTTATSAHPGLLRARMATAIGGRMPGHIERLGWGTDQLAEWQRARLRALLARAAGRSPFHAARLAGIDPARFELADLARLPVMTKAQMMEHFGEVVTDRRLSRDLAEAHLAASVAEPALLLGQYVCLVSGGSSGLRGVFVQTAEEMAEPASSLMRRAMAAFLADGGQLADGLVIGIVAAASPVHSSGMAAATAAGPPLRLISAPATWPTARIVERLNTAQPPALIGHASKLAELAREQDAGRLRLRLRAVTSVSEMLTPADRQAISGAFGVPVINAFVSTEGLVGHSDPGGLVLTFATDTCIAECVDEAGHPVPDGTPSARVLVTNLHNLTQPLIRYELTDRFTPAGTSTHGFLRASVDGRADDIFRYGTTIVHPFALTTALLRAGQVREYQVRQTARGADITVVADPGLDEAALAAAAQDSLRQAGLTEPRVTISRAETIARDPRTGKARRFVPSRPSAAYRRPAVGLRHRRHRGRVGVAGTHLPAQLVHQGTSGCGSAGRNYYRRAMRRPLADWLGRKRLLVFVGLLFVLTSVLTAIAPTLWAFLVFRVMQGMGIGAASVVSPMFISEMAPPRARGRLGFLFQFMITVGILLAYVVDWSVIELGWAWRPMFFVGIVPSLALAIGMLFLPDTPRWLGRAGRWDDAGEVLRRVAPREARSEMGGLRRSLSEADRSRIQELFRGGLKWALTLGVGLSVLQQFVGIDAVIYYAPTITGYSGFDNAANGSLVGAILVGAVFVFGEIVSLFLADRAGRRTLLLVSNGAMFLIMAAFGAMFLTHYQKQGTVLLVLILLYVLAFAIGMGPIFWLFSAEIFPTRLRGYGSSMSATGNWSADLLVSISFLTLVASIGLSFTFWIYGFFALVSVIFVYRLAPETRARPLEAIEDYWQQDRSWEPAARTRPDDG